MKKQQSLHGVNLGGWFIPERWLTPSLFKDVQAVDLYELLRHAEGCHRYQAHLASFITESDFKWLAAQGVEILRLPVGYWMLSGDELYPAAADRLDWAMKMAEKYQLKVLLDLHGAKGSQNGEMHSGRKGVVGWRKYQEEAIDVLAQIAKRYRDSPSFWGIELVNEPKLGWSYINLVRFYRRAYAVLRQVLRPGTYTVFHDAFHPLLLNGALRPRKGYPVVIDVHWYAILPRLFGKLSLSRYLKIQRICYGGLLRILRLFQPVIVGEWSSVLPQQMFNRTPRDAHYALLEKNIAAQQALYSSAMATMYWNYKADGKGMWNARSLMETGALRKR